MQHMDVFDGVALQREHAYAHEFRVLSWIKPRSNATVSILRPANMPSALLGLISCGMMSHSSDATLLVSIAVLQVILP
jgi:hypothetical protein